MKQNQTVHISMVNSYNVLIKKISIEEIFFSGLGVFAHSQNESDAMESIEFMIRYFKDLEMYEKCAELKSYIDETFNEDGTFKKQTCCCDMPDIIQYNPPICSICNMKIKV